MPAPGTKDFELENWSEKISFIAQGSTCVALWNVFHEKCLSRTRARQLKPLIRQLIVPNCWVTRLLNSVKTVTATRFEVWHSYPRFDHLHAHVVVCAWCQRCSECRLICECIALALWPVETTQSKFVRPVLLCLVTILPRPRCLRTSS